MTNLKWTPRRRRAAYMMACEPKTYTEIAKDLNITVQTLWNYRQYDNFNREVGKLAARENQRCIDVQIALRFNLLMDNI